MPPLSLLVFAVGTGSLGAEIAAVRLLAPYFGASTVVWANTIGVVLVALSIGYWLGGRLADRRPEMRGLCLLALSAAGLLALVPFAADPLLDIAVDALDSISAGAFVGSLVGVLGLVAVPVLLLGAVSPYALRLAVSSVEEAGTVAGRLYALSTAGSLVGTLTSALLFIPLVGTRRTFLIFALAIAVVAVAGLRPRGAGRSPRPRSPRSWRSRSAPSRPRPATGAWSTRRRPQYQYARVVERAERRPGARAERGPGPALALRARHRAHRRLLGRLPGDAVRGAATGLRAGSRSSATRPGPPPPRTGSCSRARGSTAWRSTPSCPRSAGAASTCGNPRLRLHHEDARPYLRTTDERYDMIARRRLPPALHPVLPDDEGVLRAGARPAHAGRRGDGERGPSRGRGRPREGADAPRWARSFRHVARDPIEDTNTILAASDGEISGRRLRSALAVAAARC